MGKFCGIVGYGITKEDEDNPGIWTTQIIERTIFGETLSNYRQLDSSSGNLNDDINISAKVSFVADPYAYENYQYIKYIQYGGAKWKAKFVDPTSYPRLIVTLGGLYNGE